MKKTAALGLIFAGIFSGFAFVSCGSRESNAEGFAAILPMKIKMKKSIRSMIFLIRTGNTC